MYNFSFDVNSWLDKTCRELLALLTSINIEMLTTDDWVSNARALLKEKYLTGKIFYSAH
ncbi:IS1 family transposase [Pantoea cypripedii]|nr:IS1 family transposase [Pantoea cypripedii]